MRVKIGAVQRVKERGEAARVLCNLQLFTQVSTWISFRKLNALLSSEASANGAQHLAWDKSPLDATAFLFDMKQREALAAEIESRVIAQRLPLEDIFGDRVLVQGSRRNERDAGEMNRSGRNLGGDTGGEVVLGDYDVPVALHMHSSLVKNLVRVYAGVERLQGLNALAAVSSRFNRFAVALGLAVALVSAVGYVQKRTYRLGVAAYGFTAGVVLSAAMVHEVLRKRVHGLRKVVEDRSTSVGEPEASGECFGTGFGTCCGRSDTDKRGRWEWGAGGEVGRRGGERGGSAP